MRFQFVGWGCFFATPHEVIVHALVPEGTLARTSPWDLLVTCEQGLGSQYGTPTWPVKNVQKTKMHFMACLQVSALQ
jgi:hypothetical protein